MTIILTWIAITAVIWAALFVGLILWDSIPVVEDREMDPEYPKPNFDKPRPSTRFVTTLPGDSLALGIRRAFILSSEYDAVCLLHDGTPVMVTFDSDVYSVEAEWRQTRAIQQARRVCNGKGNQ